MNSIFYKKETVPKQMTVSVTVFKQSLR